MALPILAELNQEITRLTVAGSSHAQGDPRLKKYIPALEKLSAKAPIFGTLAQRLTTLVEVDSNGTADTLGIPNTPHTIDNPTASSEALMNVAMLLTSIMYTQGSHDTGAEIQELTYAHNPLAITQTPYSQLHEVIEILESGSQKEPTIPQNLFARGHHRDPRLYISYLKAITDGKSPISNFVCDTILPDIGTSILPYLRAEFNPKGSERHARILKLLGTLMGKDALPLAEKAMAEGEPHVIAEALRILGQDQTYEETLLAYVKDRKGDIRGAAFAGLAFMGSAQGDELLLKELNKTSISFLEEALIQSKSPAVVAKILEQATLLSPNYGKQSAKLRTLLSVMAARSEPECLTFLENLLAKKKFFAEASYDLQLHKIMDKLCASESEEKVRMVVKMCDGDTSRIEYKLKSCIRLYSAEEVYNHCHKDAKSYPSTFYSCYSIHNYSSDTAESNTTLQISVPDTEKPWDRRWAQLYAKDHPEWAWELAYDDDIQTWRTMLNAAAAKVKKISHPGNKMLCNRVLIEAFKRNNSDARKYFDKFVENGVPQKELAEEINQAVPGAIEDQKE